MQEQKESSMGPGVELGWLYLVAVSLEFRTPNTLDLLNTQELDLRVTGGFIAFLGTRGLG